MSLYVNLPQTQHLADIGTSVIYRNGSPAKIFLDYVICDPKTSGSKEQNAEVTDKKPFSEKSTDR